MQVLASTLRARLLCTILAVSAVSTWTPGVQDAGAAQLISEVRTTRRITVAARSHLKELGASKRLEDQVEAEALLMAILKYVPDSYGFVVGHARKSARTSPIGVRWFCIATFSRVTNLQGSLFLTSSEKKDFATSQAALAIGLDAHRMTVEETGSLDEHGRNYLLRKLSAPTFRERQVGFGLIVEVVEAGDRESLSTCYKQVETVLKRVDGIEVEFWNLVLSLVADKLVEVGDGT